MISDQNALQLLCATTEETATMPPTTKDLRINAPTKAVVQAMLKNKGEKPVKRESVS